MRFLLYGLILGVIGYQVFIKPRALPVDAALPYDTRILAFGDSLTFGTGAQTGYPERLAQLLRVEVINGGVPGEVSAQGLARLGSLLEVHRPHIGIVCHGGNDILRRLDLAQTEANVRAMISLARTSGAKVVLVGVPTFSGVRITTADFYGKIAKETGVVYVPDALSDVLKSAALKSDRVHPNDEEYAQLASALREVLLRSF